MTTPVRNPDSDVAQRIMRLRQVIEGVDHGSQSRMAARVGVSHSRWNNVERGLPVSAEMESIIVDHIPGMSIDWLRRGSVHGLSAEMAQLLLSA